MPPNIQRGHFLPVFFKLFHIKHRSVFLKDLVCPLEERSRLVVSSEISAFPVESDFVDFPVAALVDEDNFIQPVVFDFENFSIVPEAVVKLLSGSVDPKPVFCELVIGKKGLEKSVRLAV